MLKNLFKRPEKRKPVDIQKLNEKLLADNQRLINQYNNMIAATK